MSIRPYNEYREFVLFLKSVFIIFVIGIIMLFVMTTLRPVEKSFSSTDHNACKFEIPGIPDMKFCQATDNNGIYYYNKHMLVRLP